MKRKRKGKITADSLVILCGLIIAGYVIIELRDNRWFYPALVAAGAVMLVAGIDIYRLTRKAAESGGRLAEIPEIGQLILLDEEEKPVKSWNLAGRTALVIGKRGSERVDIDLTDCEYSCFIDYQHAVLNFSLDCWYVEDLESRNGVRIKKVEDGRCYKIMGRPCKVTAGDILYIANTRLLLS